MSMNQILAAAVMTLALSTAACAKSEPEQPAAPAQKQMSHEGMDMDHSQMKDDCDMQGMDMSNMSAEAHQAMMDKCQKHDATNDEHGGH